MFKCDICKEELNYEDEVIGLNCNDEVVSLSEYNIENNANNPDYWTRTICTSCYEEK